MTVESLEKEFPGAPWKAIFGMAKSMALNSDHRDDLIQLGVLAVLKSYPDSITTYYVNAARNAMLDSRKHELARRRWTETLKATAKTHDEFPFDAVHAATTADEYTDEEKLLVRAAADVVSKTDPEILPLAKELRVSERALRSRLHRFREKIRKKESQ